MVFSNQLYHYEVKLRQHRLNSVITLKAGFDEKIFLKRYFSRRPLIK